ncbi:MAG: cytochrome c-type biogenesis protein CcmH [Alphaproteobacteria bacterium]|nr:MAG: cytochrome c-type biogenesis protein CcmH [Alphaproteobacteria bacterium]
MRRMLIMLLLLAPLAAAAAVAVDETQLADPAAEAEARAIMREIRCLVCQNQSIEDSNADLARDLRQIVRQRVAAGDDAAAVKAYLVARYGDWVLLEPPFKPATLILWLFPPALFLALVAYALHRARRRRLTAPPPLDETERARLARLLDKDGDAA